MIMSETELRETIEWAVSISGLRDVDWSTYFAQAALS